MRESGVFLNKIDLLEVQTFPGVGVGCGSSGRKIFGSQPKISNTMFRNIIGRGMPSGRGRRGGPPSGSAPAPFASLGSPTAGRDSEGKQMTKDIKRFRYRYQKMQHESPDNPETLYKKNKSGIDSKGKVYENNYRSFPKRGRFSNPCVVKNTTIVIPIFSKQLQKQDGKLRQIASSSKTLESGSKIERRTLLSQANIRVKSSRLKTSQLEYEKGSGYRAKREEFQYKYTPWEVEGFQSIQL